ncbi:hypothetical protein LARI1_G001231 [Lachnellula arida]|uniref:Autophagy-related protein 28 n=1 Tax=Lachnellula arida TaxID=1316785 RepID=A0A8T9BTT7_9HELO|nr:hypothetical protein LARI1_G001231 [Lachnellula arida]
MSPTSFFSRSLSRDSSQSNPLLPQDSNRGSFSLQNLSPRGAASRTASPSPPPSFYRDSNPQHTYNASPSPSPSPSRTKAPARRIQFAAPPPPIATSVFLQAPSKSHKHENKGWDSPSKRSGSPQMRRGNSIADPLVNLERREKAIQHELQLLLDAQSTGLIQGFGGTGEEGSDAGSSTPTSRSVHVNSARSSSRNGGIVPVRQPKRKTIGLKGARRGLLRDMGELVGIKSEEVGILTEEIERRDEVLAQVETWEKRIDGAREQLSGYAGDEGGGEEAVELAELRTEERAVENEIREMEDRLLQMKARKRWLGEQIKESVNRQEARLSSYRGALREAEGQVKEFLRRPPIPVSVIMGDEGGFYALPPSRRTLGMAREWWLKESASLTTKREETEKEKQALEEGALMWEDAVGVVSEFEDELRKQMKSGEAQDKQLFRSQVGKMGVVIEKLKDIMGTAEDRGWNLLICAVGAELQAFTEGEGLLRSALEFAEQQQKDDDEPGGVATNGLNELSGLGDEKAGKAAESQRSESVEREESEDDDPNLAELMIDRENGDVD